LSHLLLPGDNNVFVLQFVVNRNETTQEDESLTGDKIISPFKEPVSEVEKLVRAGVYHELHFFYVCFGRSFYQKCSCNHCMKINSSWTFHFIVR
jgi:hypothetical protein